MRKSLYDLLKNQFEESDGYYYSERTIYRNYDFKSLILDDYQAEKYIKEHFRNGGKIECFKEKMLSSSHSLSVFFMGMLIAERTNLESQINNYFRDRFSFVIDSSTNYTFEYYWYLLSLFHDQSYYYENKRLNIKFNNIFEGLNVLNSPIDKVFNEKYEFVYCANRYSKELYEKYWVYRTVEMSKNDHGILGGINLYNRAKLNLEKAIMRNVNRDAFNFGYNNLNWSVHQLDVFKVLSYAIMEHNIWCIEDIGLAQSYGLMEIASTNFKKISPTEEPLLFLLCFIDVLDPNKFVSNNDEYEDYLEFLKIIEMQFENQRVKIFSDFDISKYGQHIASMSNWINVIVDYQKNSVVISW